jgi:hypothetical protein
VAEDRPSRRPLPAVKMEPRVTAQQNNTPIIPVATPERKDLRVSPADRFIRQANAFTTQISQRLEPTRDPVKAFHALGSYKRRTQLDLLQSRSMNNLSDIQTLAVEQNQVLEQIIHELKKNK